MMIPLLNLDKKSLGAMLFYALCIGVGGGLGSVLFHFMITGSMFVFYGTTGTGSFLERVAALPFYVHILLPALGGLLVGAILSNKKVKEAEGEGVPEVIEAIALSRSKIKPWTGPVKALVSAISIGSGGAGGREGPVVQIGSWIGSTVGQYLGLNQIHTKTLLGAGAAAAIGGTFNAPVAGIVFASEILLKKVNVKIFLLLAVAAGVGTLTANVLLSHTGTAFKIPHFENFAYIEYAAFIVLALLGGLIALMFTVSLRLSERLFKRIPGPHMLKPALGGLCIGLLALMVPEVHELAAYVVMDDVFQATSISIGFIFLLLLAKILATSFTLGSGGSGGILAPSLFIGAMLGMAYGSAVSLLFPDMATSPIIYACLGMGAVFAGASHAPLTAIVLTYELTGSYLLIIPLVVVCFLSVLVTKKLGGSGLYTLHKKDDSSQAL